MSIHSKDGDPRVRSYDFHRHRYRNGAYRAEVCRDLVLTDIQPESRPTILDIGCGRGFFDDPEMQRSLAETAGKYWGVEPDDQIEIPKWCSRVWRTPLEESQIEPESVDLAVSAMVLEHLAKPSDFFAKLFQILRPGGVFWGFTVNRKHWFAKASLAAEHLRLKDLYLSYLHGKKGEDRYENYKVQYAANSPEQICKVTNQFCTPDCFDMAQVGQFDFYLPRGFQWIGRAMDRFCIATGMAGPLLAVRLQRPAVSAVLLDENGRSAQSR